MIIMQPATHALLVRPSREHDVLPITRGRNTLGSLGVKNCSSQCGSDITRGLTRVAIVDLNFLILSFLAIQSFVFVGHALTPDQGA